MKKYKPQPESVLGDILMMLMENMNSEEFEDFLVTQLDELQADDFERVIHRSEHEVIYKQTLLDDTYNKIVTWAKDRQIIPNGNCMTQAIKTLEEVHELIRAIDRDDKDEITDAYGDILVTIANGAYLHGTELPECAYKAYKVIEHRTGTLLPNGDFVKDK